MKAWIIVADTQTARIFAATSRSEALSEVKDLINPHARQHDQDLVTDKPGKAFGRSGGASHSMDSMSDPKEHEAHKFAREVAAELKDAHTSGEFDQLYLIATPHFLGLLRAELNNGLRQQLKGELNKEITHRDEATIKGYFLDMLGPS